jgi:hypothetical protein
MALKKTDGLPTSESLLYAIAVYVAYAGKELEPPNGPLSRARHGRLRMARSGSEVEAK